MNKCIFSGRIVKSPELESVNEIAKTSITIAVRRNFKNKDGKYDVDFVMMTAWRQNAEYIVKYIDKGDTVEVEAEFRTTSYEKDGETKFYKSFECQDIHLICHPQNKDNAAGEYIPEEDLHIPTDEEE